MQSIYLYVENHNLGTIDGIESRYDTPFQKVSNNSFKEIRKECSNFGINFDFLANNILKPGDIVIVSNLTPFIRNRLITNLIILDNKRGNYI